MYTLQIKLQHDIFLHTYKCLTQKCTCNFVQDLLLRLIWIIIITVVWLNLNKASSSSCRHDSQTQHNPRLLKHENFVKAKTSFCRCVSAPKTHTQELPLMASSTADDQDQLYSHEFLFSQQMSGIKNTEASYIISDSSCLTKKNTVVLSDCGVGFRGEREHYSQLLSAQLEIKDSPSDAGVFTYKSHEIRVIHIRCNLLHSCHARISRVRTTR